MTMSDQSAITITNLSKSYKLYYNKADLVRDLLRFKTKHPVQEFCALKNINLDVKQGQRLAIIGRNGAGKTTLLKMITGNFRANQGNIKVNGRVQALINLGIGFHPEFSGYDNISAALAYNGLDQKEIEAAIEDIVDFVELGDFIHQPLKSYSLGMQSRLYFATATAIKPEILIVDEVLGAGDAYFSAKSAERMKKLTSNGCTLLLVSHSTSQVLQFCDEAIWIECGEIIKQGEALEVVKAYEAYTKRLEFEYHNHVLSDTTQVSQSKWLREKLLHEALSIDTQSKAFPDNQTISRWPSKEDSLKITNVQILDANNQPVAVVNTLDTVHIEIEIVAKQTGIYDCSFVVVLFAEDGRLIFRNCSPVIKCDLVAGEKKSAKLIYDKLLLGNGRYIFTAAIYKVLDLNDLSTAIYYDLLARSFEFRVLAPYRDDSSILFHPCEWNLKVMDAERENINVCNLTG